MPYGLIGYADSNFAEDLKDQKSVISYCFFLNKVVIFWNSKKQRTLFILITKVRYIALEYIAKEAIWIKRFINKMKLKVIKDFTLYRDNKISITLIKNIESNIKQNILTSKTIISRN